MRISQPFSVTTTVSSIRIPPQPSRYTPGSIVIAIPVAAGVLYPFGILISPAIGALAMSASSITVATNAVLLKRVEPQLRMASASAVTPADVGSAHTPTTSGVN